jgi:hypothetical protein
LLEVGVQELTVEEVLADIELQPELAEAAPQQNLN